VVVVGDGRAAMKWRIDWPFKVSIEGNERRKEAKEGNEGSKRRQQMQDRRRESKERRN
jgi:hypothetical protein